MPRCYDFTCECGWTGNRYRNAKRCPQCKSILTRVEPPNPVEVLRALVHGIEAHFVPEYCEPWLLQALADGKEALEAYKGQRYCPIPGSDQ